MTYDEAIRTVESMRYNILLQHEVTGIDEVVVVWMKYPVEGKGEMIGLITLPLYQQNELGILSQVLRKLLNSISSEQISHSHGFRENNLKEGIRAKDEEEIQ